MNTRYRVTETQYGRYCDDSCNRMQSQNGGVSVKSLEETSNQNTQKGPNAQDGCFRRRVKFQWKENSLPRDVSDFTAISRANGDGWTGRKNKTTQTRRQKHAVT